MTNTTACDDQDSTHWEDRDETYQPCFKLLPGGSAYIYIPALGLKELVVGDTNSAGAGFRTVRVAN